MVLQKQDKAMLELAKQLKDCNSLMFFARGNNYATALEAALKVSAVRRAVPSLTPAASTNALAAMAVVLSVMRVHLVACHGA